MKPIGFKAINNEKTKIKGLNVQTNSESVNMGDYSLDYYHQNKYFSSVKVEDGNLVILNAKGESLYSIEMGSGGGTSFITVEGNPVALQETTLYHKTSGVTAGSYGETEAQTPDFGESFKVPNYSVDKWGHITSAGYVDVVLPDISDIESRLSSLEKGSSSAAALLDEINGEVI